MIGRRLRAALACLLSVPANLALAQGQGQPGQAVVTCLPIDSGAVMTAPNAAAFAAALKTTPTPIVVGAPFVVNLQVCAMNGQPIERLSIDATMPAHRHGMNYKTEIAARGDGRYEARGFLFHMPGRWEVTLSVYTGGTPSHLKLNLDVK
jgi:hypothetical protein